MKRSFIHLFVFIFILISLMASGIGVKSAYAAGSMEVVPLPLPAGWSSGFLYSVWGSSPNDVYVAGYGNNGVGEMPLLYHKDTSGWTPINLGLPSGWRSGYLFGVWGTAPNDVYVIGSGYNGAAFLPLLYHTADGVNWSVLTFSLPTGLSSGYLYDIWGSGATNVYTAGSGNSYTAPLLYQGGGSSWAAVSLPTVTGWKSINFKGMWGTGPSDVYALGSGYNGTTMLPMLFHKDASNWGALALSLPTGWGSGYLSSMWGASANDVYAVGHGYNNSNPKPLIYHGGGSSWAESSPSLPNGLAGGFLYDIWGSSATDIYTVGSGNNGSTRVPLIYHRDSTSWADASPSLPVGWSAGYLFSVWGSGASDVYAVGAGNNGITDLPLIYHSSLAGQDATAPGNVTNFAATAGTADGSVDLSWVAPADDAGNNASGPATSYLIKYSTSPFTSWSDGTLMETGVPIPAAPGSTQTMTVSGLNLGGLYYFAIRAQDEQYNQSVNYVTASASAKSPPAVNAGTYDDANSNWVYTGSWLTYTGSGPYSNTLHYTNTVGDSAQLVFNGTKFTLLYTKDNNRGSIDVYVDGNKVTTINAYSASSAFQQAYTSPAYSQGTHTVRLVHVGGAPYIDIDAIQILGASVAAPPGTYDDTNSNWVYNGSWATYTGNGPYNNTLHYTGTAGSYTELYFSGKQFKLTFTKDNNRGSIDVYVDGNKVTTVDAYSASYAFQQTYTSPTFTQGNHTVRFVHAGGRPYMDIDAIQIIGDPVPVSAGTYDDTNSSWVYTGSWATYTGVGPYSNTLHYAGTVGDYAELVFTGTKFTLFFTKDINRGAIDVYVDGSKVTTVDAYSASYSFQQTYTSPIYTQGNHTVRLVHAGGKPYIDIDAIQIFGEAATLSAGTYDDTNNNWIYTGTWSAYTGSGPYNNTLHYTSTVGSYTELSFSGTKFILTFTKDTNRGSIDVYVDGNKVTTINTYSGIYAFQQTYTSPNYTSGNHVVRFVHAGKGAYIDIDAIQIMP